jgi:hypothetical protein
MARVFLYDPPSWIGDVHPAAKLFPEMPAAEIDVLAADIAKHGLREPIKFLRPKAGGDLLLLDGRNRVAATDRAGLPVYGNGNLAIGHEIIDEIDGFDPHAYVVSANLHRRHLTAEQKREVIKTLLKAAPTSSARQIAKIAKVSDKTVGAVRAKLKARAEIPHVETLTDTKGRQQPASKGTKPRETLPKLDAADAAAVRQSRPMMLIQLSSLLRIDTGKTLEEIVRALRDARSVIAALPKETRIATARGCLRALGLDEADLRPIG